MGKDAFVIWLLVPVSIVLTLETAFVGFIPAARRGLFGWQHQAIITDIGNIPTEAVCDLVVEDGAEYHGVGNRGRIKNHAFS